MKELYSFDVKRKVVKEVPHVKEGKDGPIETTKKVTRTIKNRVIFSKPSMAETEDADFFYGQKYNEFINAGFLTKAMLAKKMGDIGGLTSRVTEERMNELITENMEAARAVQFFEGGKNLDKTQKVQLEEAKEKWASTQAELHEYETSLRSQFSQTADSKAEIKVIEWLVLNFSHFEETLEDVEDKSKTEFWPLFEGEGYEQKRGFMLQMQDPDDEAKKDVAFLKQKNIFDQSFDTLIRVASIWYNRLGSDQESIEKSLEELFTSDDEEDGGEGK